MYRNIAIALLSVLPLVAQAGPVDVNTADAATLARELDGVGDARARAIIEYREKNGRFASTDDLLKVSGIGPQVLDKNRDNIRIGGKPAGAGTRPASP